ncbi:MAG: hypothetical protein M9963_03190 [Kiritimatiellae bacterium]|nr:hypothetical protein [Kiritimatiellia bacterium]MCO5060997.1 hypothetical protein [Kiritimatiellia bacterium]
MPVPLIVFQEPAPPPSGSAISQMLLIARDYSEMKRWQKELELFFKG